MIRLKWNLGAAVSCLLMALAVESCSYKNYAGDIGIERNGNTIIVRRGGDFQAALDRAKAGDTITLEAGASFKGSFSLPNKSGTEFITIRSAATDAQLPAPGTRLDPVKYAELLPKLESNVRGKPVISATLGAHHFRFIAIEFAPTIGGLYNIIEIGSSTEKTVQELPHHIEFDRVWIHGSKTEGQRRGIAANGRFIKIENSYISDIKRKGEESQAIAAWATDGPIEITNNYLEAAAENILFGGAAPAISLVPTNCVVYGNHLNKPVEWRAEGWDVKNLLEIKNGKNIRIENNLMTNNWGMAQDGTAVLFTTRMDSGEGTIIDGVEFIGNIVRSAGAAISILGGEGAGGHRLIIRNNLFEDIDGKKWNSAGKFLKISDWDGLTIENNTIIQTGNISSAYGLPIKNFVFRNNIVFQNEYGFHGDNMAPGQSSIDGYFPGSTVSNNVIVGGIGSQYREINFYPASIKQVGFVAVESGDYRLRKESPFINKGFKGGRLGADLDPTTVGKIQR